MKERMLPFFTGTTQKYYNNHCLSFIEICYFIFSIHASKCISEIISLGDMLRGDLVNSDCPQSSIIEMMEYLAYCEFIEIELKLILQ